MPKKHVETTKREVQRLCDLGVLKWRDDSEWALPRLKIPKKDNTVWVVSDFSTVLQELEGFTYATALDFNMGYYTIRSDPDASKICTIIFQWGKYSYLRLPMGVACSPELMATLEFILTYLDDLLCISKDAGLTVNASKSSFCAVETEYLGYVLSRDGIKPQPKKVQAILALTPPQNVKQLLRFLGMVQYYRDIWERCREILASLTNLVGECGHTKVTRASKTKKKPWHWDSIHQKAFDTVKATITGDVTLAFEIYTDSSKFQFCAVITQNYRPLAFFSWKLSPMQQNTT
eukprot:CCRYP_020840-RA/>CCRYP_020840-RA protein AED:0.15 eAED:0.28 QI:0/0/0/1/0/0/3/0/289